MSFIPTSGMTAVLKVGNTPTTIPGTNWTFTFDPKLVSASNFRDGRVMIGTLADGSVSLSVVYDKTTPPTATSGFGLRPGAGGTALLYVDDTNYWTVPFVCGPVNPTNPGIEDFVRYDVTLQYSSPSVTYTAAAAPGLTYPANG